MNLSIKMSRNMEGIEAPLGRLERYVIRVPESLRQSIGLMIGDVVSVTEKNGNKRLLTIQPALLKDIVINDEIAYVSRETFDNLKFENEKNINKPLEIIEGITLGCDPEFFLINQDKKEVVYPSGFGGKKGKIGSDGALVELRPDPGNTEEEVASNLAHLVEGANEKKMNLKEGKRIEMYAYSALGYRMAGFHVHLGLPPPLKKDNPAVTNFLRHVCYVLDYYVAIPSILREEKSEIRRRTSGHYGRPGDFKLNGITLEYRVPGGHHMRAPFLASGLIGLSAAVMEDILSKTKITTSNFNNLDKFANYKHILDIYKIPDRKEIINALISETTVMAKKHIDVIATDLPKLISWDKHPSITKFIEYCAGQEKISPKIIDNWRKVDESLKAMEIF